MSYSIVVEYTIGFILPSLAGLSKALQESPYLFKQTQLLSIIQNTQPLIQNETLDHVRYAIDTCIAERGSDDYCRQVAKKYWDEKQPLSNNRLIYDLMMILRNVTGRMVTAHETKLAKEKCALSFEDACTYLVDRPSIVVRPSSADASDKDKQLSKAMRGVYVMSLGYYEDVKKLDSSTSSEMKAQSSEAYMAEIMASSLVSDETLIEVIECVIYKPVVCTLFLVCGCFSFRLSS
jgi:phosphatidylinositol 4-kinase